MRQIGKNLIGIMSCLLILATLSIFGQKQNDDFNQRFNKKPLQDFADNLNQKLDAGEVDLDKSFSITLNARLTKDGRFDHKFSKFTKPEGDVKMVAIAKDAIEALNDTNILSYLQVLGVEQVTVNFSQNEKDVLFIISSELLNEARAKTVANGFKMLFTMAKLNVKETEVKTLLNAANISTQTNNFILNFAMPKTEAHQLLKNELQKRKEKSYSSKGE